MITKPNKGQKDCISNSEKTRHMCDQMCSLRSEILTKTQCVSRQFCFKTSSFICFNSSHRPHLFHFIWRGCFKRSAAKFAWYNGFPPFIQFQQKRLISCPFWGKFQLRSFKLQKYLLILSLWGKLNLNQQNISGNVKFPSFPSILS